MMNALRPWDITKAFVAAHEAQKESATKALNQPDAIQEKREEKSRLEAIVKAAGSRSRSSSRLLLADPLFTKPAGLPMRRRGSRSLLDQREAASLHDPVRLYRGMSEVHLRQFEEAVKTLAPLAEKQSTHSPQALLWTGKALAGQADTEDEEASKQALAEAEKVLRRAAEIAKKAEASTPGLSGEILLALADVFTPQRQG